MKILIIEDDVATSNLLRQSLVSQRYAVDLAHDGLVGLELTETVDYDLVLLDLLIPKLDGISLCRQLRQREFSKPILLLTAKDSNEDIVTGLDAGADDYVTKPFKVSELLARIRALMRRGSPVLTPVLTWGNLALNPATTTATYRDRILSLTVKEYSLLELFLRNPQRVFSRNAIIDHLWALNDSPSEHAVTNLTKDLRRKLRQFGVEEDPIETIYGLGYRLKSPPEEPEANTTHQPDPNVALPSGVSKTAMSGAAGLPTEGHDLAATLKQLRPDFAQQLQYFDAVLQAIKQDELTPDAQEDARSEAHRLVGSLGTFGYAQASIWARMLEYWLIGWNQKEAAIELFEQLFKALQQEVQALPEPEFVNVTPIPKTKVGSQLTTTLMVIADDSVLQTEFEQAISGNGFKVEFIPNLQTLESQVNSSDPDGIVLDLSDITDLSTQLQLVQSLHNAYVDAQLFIIAAQDDLELRVQVSRLGVKQLFLRSTPVQDIVAAITPWLTEANINTGHVLIVDDDPVMLKIVERLLQPWGLHVTTLDDPNQFWTVLNTIAPDLLLLNVSMPTFSGLDLCSVVRQDPRWGNLVILVLTGQTDTAFIQKIFAAGADDVIQKPIVPPELVTRVVNRIERLQKR